MRETLAAFPVALVAIYMLLATLFRSYTQLDRAHPPPASPGSSSVPCARLQRELQLALRGGRTSGVVVNDSLVLVDFANRARREGMPLLEAAAGGARVRPVILTTMTTVVAPCRCLRPPGARPAITTFRGGHRLRVLFAMAARSS